MVKKIFAQAMGGFNPHQPLPRYATEHMRLRTRGHQFELLAVKYEFNKRNFSVRSFYNYE